MCLLYFANVAVARELSCIPIALTPSLRRSYFPAGIEETPEYLLFVIQCDYDELSFDRKEID